MVGFSDAMVRNQKDFMRLRCCYVVDAQAIMDSTSRVWISEGQ